MTLQPAAAPVPVAGEPEKPPAPVVPAVGRPVPPVPSMPVPPVPIPEVAPLADASELAKVGSSVDAQATAMRPAAVQIPMPDSVLLSRATSRLLADQSVGRFIVFYQTRPAAASPGRLTDQSLGPEMCNSGENRPFPGLVVGVSRSCACRG
jgi:hypothetical protein